MADISRINGNRIVVDDGSVTTDKIANGAVTTLKLADGSVSTPKISDGSVTSLKISEGGVTRSRIADGAVTNSKVADGSIDSEKLSTNAVTSVKLAGNAVTEQKIANGSVTDLKLSGNSGQVLDRVSKLEQGKVPYPEDDASGLAGQVLRSTGDGGTYWDDEHMPPTDTVVEAIDNWMNEHPEATTTVVDGSLTSAKMQLDFGKQIYRSFDTVASMASCGDLLEGMTCRTRGFHRVGDGGSADYVISADGTADGSFIIECGGLYAVLMQTGESYNFRQLGAVPDPSFDCSAMLELFVEKAASLPCNRLYIPSGKWYFSETLLTSVDGVEIYGSHGYGQYSSVSDTVICGLTEGQLYIWKLGGTEDIDEASLPYASRFSNSYLHNLCFSGNQTGEYFAALVMRLCLFNRFDDLMFVGVPGGCIDMSTSWEDMFGFVMIRSSPGFVRPKIAFSKTKSVTGVSVSPNISSCVFETIHAETFNTALLSAIRGSNFVNNAFGVVTAEATMRTDGVSSDPWSEELAQEATPLYFIDMLAKNTSFQSILVTTPSVRTNIYTVDAEHSYYRDALIRIPSAEGSAESDLCAIDFGNVQIRNQTANFVLYKSHSAYADTGLVRGNVMLENNTSTLSLFDIADGVVPLFTFMGRTRSSLPMMDDFTLRGGGVCSSINNLSAAYQTVGLGRSSSNTVGTWWFAGLKKLYVFAYNDNDANSGATVRVMNNTGSSSYETHTLSFPPGFSTQEVTPTTERDEPTRVAILNGSGNHIRVVKVYAG